LIEINIFSREFNDSEMMNGRIDAEKLKQLFDFEVLETTFSSLRFASASTLRLRACPVWKRSVWIRSLAIPMDAALRAGADLPYACKGGVCATCRCKVLSGEVDM
jgi:ring-1,2-phenylacetyl-CoA epoxidase subunit PaaE